MPDHGEAATESAPGTGRSAVHGTGRTSLAAKAFVAALRLTRKKRVFSDEAARDASIRRNRKNDRGEPPRWLTRRFDVERTEIDGRPCHTIRPRAGASRRHVLYFHGGAYVHQIQKGHWKFFARLVSRAGCAVTVPIYPLAPEHRCPETLAFTHAAYRRFAEATAPGDRILMGDSAGGGLALDLARTARDRGLPPPKETVLLCPWLDTRMTEPALWVFDRRDPYLGITGLDAAARRYAGPLDRADPRLSPLLGDLAGVGRLTTFIGTRDVLLADARRLRSRCAEQRVPLEYHEYPGMIHAWMLAALPEARRATAELARVIGRD